MSVGNQITPKSGVKLFLISIAIMTLFYTTQNSIAAMPEISFACQVYHPKAGEEAK